MNNSDNAQSKSRSGMSRKAFFEYNKNNFLGKINWDENVPCLFYVVIFVLGKRDYTYRRSFRHTKGSFLRSVDMDF